VSPEPESCPHCKVALAKGEYYCGECEAEVGGQDLSCGSCAA